LSPFVHHNEAQTGYQREGKIVDFRACRSLACVAARPGMVRYDPSNINKPRLVQGVSVYRTFPEFLPGEVRPEFAFSAPSGPRSTRGKKDCRLPPDMVKLQRLPRLADDFLRDAIDKGRS
jgi:hypothetical protein